MTTPQKRKGSAWELAVARYLAENGFRYAERRYGAGAQADKGDINGLPGIVIECKAHEKFNLAGWMDEAEVERQNAQADYGIVIAKRRGRGAADAYAVMPVSQLARLLKEAGH